MEVTVLQQQIEINIMHQVLQDMSDNLNYLVQSEFSFHRVVKHIISLLLKYNFSIHVYKMKVSKYRDSQSELVF